MVDPRVKKVAEILVNYSVKVKKGENVIVSGSNEAGDLIKEIYKLVIKKGAYPSVKVGLAGMNYLYYKYASDEQLRKFPQISFDEIKKTQAYIGIISDSNTRELSNISPKKIAVRTKTTSKISDYIVNAGDKIRRVTTIYPTEALAQEAEMSLQEYGDFVFNSMIQDWSKLNKKFVKLQRVLNKSKKLRIIGEDTDIMFNIYRNSFIVDAGEENLPGGEVFGAPEKYSAKGYIRFSYPAIRNGVEVTNIYAEFKNGRCVKASADKNEKFLKAMLNTDAGAKYIGEIGIGMNPRVNKFTRELLFDEKIIGTIHLAFGMAYKGCGQPNKSALHWDIVKDIKKGSIYLDGKKVYHNKKWLV